MADFSSITLAFKRNPALGFALIIGVIVLLYIVYKQNNSGTQPNSQSNTPNMAEIYAFDITPPGPVGASAPPTPTSNGGGTTITGGTGTGGTLPIGAIHPNPIPAPSNNTLKVVSQGALSTVYGGVHNGGRDLTTLYPGNTVTITGGPVSWGYDNYYQVNYGSQSGWVRAATIGK